MEQLQLELEQKTKELARLKARFEPDLQKQFRSLSAESPEKIRISGTSVDPQDTKLWYVFEDQIFDSFELALCAAKNIDRLVTVYSFAQAVGIVKRNGFTSFSPRYRTDSSYVNSTGQTVYRVYVDGACANEGLPAAQAGVGVWFGRCNPMNVSEPLSGTVQTSQRAVFTALLKAYKAIDTLNNGLQYEIYTESSYAVDCLTQWYVNWMKNGWTESDGTPVLNKDLIEQILVLKGRDSCANVVLRISRQ
ncbi:Ribonuclease H1 [Yarrowia sp. C11]|nr:Ribonuclease H1 [Yarrowia sp. E02]KAG5369690.1 Ribonuclease H1 [Yarrowia sp. C11]